MLGIPTRGAEDNLAHDDTLPQAAGVLFVSPEGRVLLMHRSPNETNYGGHWALPGGGAEDGEGPADTAKRETEEETGYKHDGPLKVMSKVKTPNGTLFTTFGAPVDVKFAPTMTDDEHTGFTWADPAHLPSPLHPQVEKLLGPGINVGEQMADDDWKEVRENLARWVREEEAEDEDNAAIPLIDENDTVGDSAVAIAMDRDTVRETTRDGRLKIKVANISKANVSPYRGSEIPGWQDLGLDPDRIYNLLRDPDELRKAVDSLNGVQLLRKHVPVNAEDHRPYDTVGSLGTDAEFDGTYLKNSLFVNARDAIDGIESGQKRELSAGYHYKPDMTPGNFNGKAYDGVMRDIEFNHVALVEDGRAGPDVVVGDSKEKVMSKPTRFALLALSTAAAQVRPLIAMDSKVTLPYATFAKLTSKNFKDHKSTIVNGVRTALDGKLRPGLALDASMATLAKALDTFADLDDEVDKANDDLAVVDPTPGEGGTLRDFLIARGLSEEDVAKACAMIPAAADEDDDKKDDDKDDDKKKQAQDEDDDEDEKKKKDERQAEDRKQAMDQAIASAVKTERQTQNGIRVALAEIKPWVGDIPSSMAFDSAADVYRHAAGMLGIEGHKTMHADALLPVIKAQRRPGDKAAESRSNALAMDSSGISKARQLAPGLEQITISR